MKCQAVRSLLSQKFLDKTHREVSGELQRHLISCSKCRRLQENFQHIYLAFQREQRAELSGSWVSQLVKNFGSVEKRKRRIAPLWWWSGAVIVLVLGFMFFSSDPESQSAKVEESTDSVLAIGDSVESEEEKSFSLVGFLKKSKEKISGLLPEIDDVLSEDLVGSHNGTSEKVDGKNEPEEKEMSENNNGNFDFISQKLNRSPLSQKRKKREKMQLALLESLDFSESEKKDQSLSKNLDEKKLKQNQDFDAIRPEFKNIKGQKKEKKEEVDFLADKTKKDQLKKKEGMDQDLLAEKQIDDLKKNKHDKKSALTDLTPQKDLKEIKQIKEDAALKGDDLINPMVATEDTDQMALDDLEQPILPIEAWVQSVEESPEPCGFKPSTRGMNMDFLASGSSVENMSMENPDKLLSYQMGQVDTGQKGVHLGEVIDASALSFFLSYKQQSPVMERTTKKQFSSSSSGKGAGAIYSGKPLVERDRMNQILNELAEDPLEVTNQALIVDSPQVQLIEGQEEEGQVYSLDYCPEKKSPFILNSD